MDPKSLPKPGFSIIDKLAVDKFLVEKLGFGGIPAYYNPRIHGPYRPDVYYGPSKFIFEGFERFFSISISIYTFFCPFTEDTPLAKVKLGELPAWLSRRSADPRMMMACIGRANARWQLNYHHAVRPGLAPLFQIWAWCIVTGFVASYHKQCKWFYFLNDLSVGVLSTVDQKI